MDLVDLLDSDAAYLPFTGDSDIEKQLRDRFDAYFAKAEDLTSSNPANQEFLRALCDSQALANAVSEALGHWLDAAPELALNALNNGLSRVAPQVGELTSPGVPTDTTGPMFRARVADLGARLGLPEMFHIPFELRDRVGTQRYSFPGLPCLYVGQSLYVCWEELGRPDLHALWVSKVVVAPEHSIRVLDLGHRPATIAAGLEAALAGRSRGMPLRRATAYAVLWPLIAACSVKRSPSRNRSFVVEYVVPQLLLRWLVRTVREGKKDRLDGIRYFSTHIEEHEANLAGMNYVFPAQKRGKVGFCPQLREKFHLTHPTSWQLATAEITPPPQPRYNNFDLQLTKGWSADYRFTVFSRVEGFLDRLQAQAIP